MLVVAVGLCFWQNDLLLAIANGPLPDGREPITFGVTEPFFTTVKLSLYAGILLALPGAALPGLRLHPAGVQAGASGGWCCRC